MKKFNKIPTLIICILIYFNAIAQQPTKLGIHGTSNPDVVDLGAQIVRFGATDYQIKEAINNSSSEFLDDIVTLDSLGIQIVFHLTHPKDTAHNDPNQPKIQRIPSGTDSLEVFQYLGLFLDSVGQYLDWIQISQEPFGKTSYDSIYTISEVMDWWRKIAVFIREKQSNNPQKLGHLKLVTGGISVDNPWGSVGAAVDSIISFGEDYCDAISLHLHTSSLSSGIDVISTYKNKTQHPLACTEWSQAKAAVTAGWIGSVNSIWTNAAHPYYNLTYYQIISDAYNNPMDSSAWNAIIATSPYDSNFIAGFYDYMDNNCFQFACYGGLGQYGQPQFDWKQLFATKTVQQQPFPNMPFFSDFVSLTTQLNSGNYQTACLTTDVKEHEEWIKFKLFPNPADDHIKIQSEKPNLFYEIFNSYGQLISSGQYHNQIDISNFVSGIYFLKISDKTNTKTVKLIKQ